MIEANVRVNHQTLRLCKSIFALLLIVMFAVPITAQNTEICPTVPAGLQRVNSLKWMTENTILLSVGENTQNDYIQRWLVWDVTSGELSSTTLQGVYSALQFAADLGLNDTFYSYVDRSFLQVSPNTENALYMNDYRLIWVSDDLEPIELGLLPENFADMEIYWISDNEIVVVIEPLYGEHYAIFHACLDGSCFINLSDVVDGVFGRPTINSELATVLFVADSDMVIYDLQTDTVTNRIATEIRTIPFLQPVQDFDSESIYFVGFDTAGIYLNLYQLNIATEQIEVVTSINAEIDVPMDWLISTDQQYMIFANPSISIQCY